MEWMEVKVLTTTEAADLISELLLEAGSEGTVIEDRNDVFANQRPEGQWDIIDPAIAERIGADVKVAGYFPADEHLADTLAALRERLAPPTRDRRGPAAGQAGARDQRLRGRGLVAELEARLQAGAAGRALRRPSRAGPSARWKRATARSSIDPGLAFGTGTHETTGMCATLVEKYVRPGMKVIDIGTGSGILAIAAAQMGRCARAWRPTSTP